MKRISLFLIIAKIWATIVALFLAFFLSAHLLADKGIKYSEAGIVFLFFPLLATIGYGLILIYPRIGSVLALVGFIVLFFYDISLLFNPLFAFVLFPPSLLISIILFVIDFKNNQNKKLM